MKKFFSLLFVAFVCFLFIYEPKMEHPPAIVDTAGELVVSYIDVGQGDSIFIEFPGGKTALIDAGEAENVSAVTSYLRQRNCDEIDYLICTHPHSDHIGGMSKVLSTFSVGEVYMPRVEHTSKTYEKLLIQLNNLGLPVYTAKAGAVLSVEPEIEFVMLAPVSGEYDELNDYSAVLRLTYGESSFLFTGDAEKLSEKEMLDSGQNLTADVLKVGHHGSSTSSHQAFLDAVNPTYAVISCDGNNEYGHPHKKVVKRLDNSGITIYRTDLYGTVMAISDGQRIDFVTEVE